MEAIGYIVGALVGVLVLYIVVRLAVTHAIVATRPKPPTRAVEAPTPKTWFNQEPS